MTSPQLPFHPLWVVVLVVVRVLDEVDHAATSEGVAFLVGVPVVRGVLRSFESDAGKAAIASVCAVRLERVVPACTRFRQTHDPVPWGTPASRHGNPAQVENGIGVLPLQEHVQAHHIAAAEANDPVGCAGPEVTIGRG